MSVTVHGQKQFISAEPRNVVDVLLELWLAASSAGGGTAAGEVDAKAGGARAGFPSEVRLSAARCTAVEKPWRMRARLIAGGGEV